MSFIEEIKALEAFTNLPRARRNLVIYSEGPEYWPHFRGVLKELLETHHCPFIFITSSEKDPGLKLRHPLVRTFNVGEGGGRKNFFADIEADIMALTMPDLGQLTLKKSDGCGEYVYLFHSPVSTHLIYRDGAFDHYDTVLCAGPHHETEIRAREQQKGLPEKRLVQHGYGRLDEIIADVPADEPLREGPAHVLVAPSWGPTGLFETMGNKVVGALLDAGFKVTARPHPQTRRLSAEKIGELKEAFGGNPLFTLETDMADKTSFYESDIAISDWSGAAFDYAFSRLRPVVFIDTPKKMNNPSYAELGIEPMEAAIRSNIGAVVDPSDIASLPETIRRLVDKAGSVREAITEERTRWIYNVGTSAKAAAAELARLSFNASLGDDGAVENLDARCRNAVSEMLGAVPSEETKDGAISLHETLADLLARASAFGENDYATLEALCRRIDIFKKLHEHYDAALMKPADAKTPAKKETYPALAYCLIAASQKSASDAGLAMKFLNGAANALGAYEDKGGARAAVALESLLSAAFDRIGDGA
ncbi:hypothetical protein [Hyphococcus sp.]|uniref:hypothetical protein n=1 Tax=Hyphococcus sp. TaxID=2038636 RepID=UPI0035C74EEC